MSPEARNRSYITVWYKNWNKTCILFETVTLNLFYDRYTFKIRTGWGFYWSDVCIMLWIILRRETQIPTPPFFPKIWAGTMERLSNYWRQDNEIDIAISGRRIAGSPQTVPSSTMSMVHTHFSLSHCCVLPIMSDKIAMMQQALYERFSDLATFRQLHDKYSLNMCLVYEKWLKQCPESQPLGTNYMHIKLPIRERPLKPVHGAQKPHMQSGQLLRKQSYTAYKKFCLRDGIGVDKWRLKRW